MIDQIGLRVLDTAVNVGVWLAYWWPIPGGILTGWAAWEGVDWWRSRRQHDGIC